MFGGKPLKKDEKRYARNPRFIIWCGPMFGGKTSWMLAAIDRAKYQSRTVAAFKPKMDHRYTIDKIVTHGGAEVPAMCVSTGKEILGLSAGADVIAVDEAFMIDGAADALIKLFKSGKDVYVSSIQLSSTGEPFDEIQKMFPWATQVEVCPAVCPISGADAFYTIATVEGLDKIHVGGEEVYSPRCHEHTFFMNGDE